MKAAKKQEFQPLPQAKPRLLTKGRFITGWECPTKLFYTKKNEYADTKNDDLFLKALARGGFQVGKLAQIYQGPGDEVTEQNYDKAWEETKLLLSKDQSTVFEASIRYKNHFVKVDVLKRNGNTLEIIEVKAKSWEEETSFFTLKGELYQNAMTEKLYDIAYQTWVVKNAFKKENYFIRPFLYLINKRATSPIEGFNQMFKILPSGTKGYTVKVTPTVTKEQLGEEILIKVPVQDAVTAIHESRDTKDIHLERDGKNYDAWVQWLADSYENDQKAKPVLTPECKKCEFRIDPKDYLGKKSGFDICWREAGHAAPHDRPRSFDIWYSPNAKKLFKDKIYFMDKVQEEDIKPKSKPKLYEETNPLGGMTKLERQVLQIEMARDKKKDSYFHKDLKVAMDLSKPYHFIDFETSLVAIPFNKGRRPYEMIAFQFSHHIMDETGKIEHKTQWLGTQPGFFPNYEFVRQLKKALSTDKGTVFRYADHENTVLNQILLQLHESNEIDKAELIEWIKTLTTPTAGNAKKFGQWKPKREFVDLLEYVTWFYYHPMMGGSNSIKGVLPAMLNSSEFLKTKYSKDIYGKNKEIKSLNLESKVWVRLDEKERVIDPYSDLGPIFPDNDVSRTALDDGFGDEDSAELRDGGAAMMAYCRLQFGDLTLEQRNFIEAALLRYCELDTLAMAMIWEGWGQQVLNFTQKQRTSSK